MKLKTFLLFCLLSTNCCAKKVSDFESMLAGFSDCRFESVYINEDIDVPSHKYFTDRSLKPYKIENNFAYYKVNEKFYGLSVIEIIIPASTFFAYAIVINEDVKSTKNKISKYFPAGFCVPNDEDSCNVKPVLDVYSEDRTKTTLSCFSDI